MTSLSSTVGTNSANITTTANTLASVSGSVSAAYTLSITAGGRVTGFQLLNGVAGSSFVVQSDKFVIVDSSGNYATSPFVVTGGVVYIQDANVQNLTVSKLTAGDFYTDFRIGSSGAIRSTQTAFDTGTGFWLGNDGGTPKFSIGNSAGNKMTWNGTDLRITGTLVGATLEAATLFAAQTDGSGEGGQLAIDMPTGTDGYWAIDVFSDNKLRFFIEGNAGAYAVAQASFEADLLSWSYNTASTIRLKKNVATIPSALSMVERMRGVTFDWIDGRKNNDIGFIAEEVNEVVPQVVHKNEVGQIESLDYGRLTSLLVQAVKELSAEVKLLKAKLNGE